MSNFIFSALKFLTFLGIVILFIYYPLIMFVIVTMTILDVIQLHKTDEDGVYFIKINIIKLFDYE